MGELPVGELPVGDSFNKLLLKFFIRDQYTSRLRDVCHLNLRKRVCRGGSRELYRLMMEEPHIIRQYGIDPEQLQIVSGLGHTYLRYKNIYIDPTIGQFDPTKSNDDFEGIFVGDIDDLRILVEKQRHLTGSKINLGDYLGSKVKAITVETNLMEEIKRKLQRAGSRRANKRRRTRKRRK